MCEMHSCWPTCVAMGVAWWLIASALLFATWNKVLVPLFAFKKGKFWQALLLLTTVIVLCIPCASKKGCPRAGKCESGHCEHHAGGGEEDHHDAKAKK